MTNIYKTSLPTQTLTNYSIGTGTGSNGTWNTIGATGAVGAASYVTNGSVLTVNGNPASLDVKGKVFINGLDLEERLKTIEKVLAIPERDVTMEAKYPSLKKKFDEYINALEKYKTFERVKGTYD